MYPVLDYFCQVFGFINGKYQFLSSDNT